MELEVFVYMEQNDYGEYKINLAKTGQILIVWQNINSEVVLSQNY